MKTGLSADGVVGFLLEVLQPRKPRTTVHEVVTPCRDRHVSYPACQRTRGRDVSGRNNRQIDSLSDGQRDYIENCKEATDVCEWCADGCLGDAEMEEGARLCRDVTDLAEICAESCRRMASA